MSHYVYGGNETDPNYATAKDLHIECYKAMAVKAESGPWRNFYLAGAMELEHFNDQIPAPTTLTPAVVSNMTVDMTLDYLSIRLNAPKVYDADYTILLNFDETADQSGLYTDAMMYVKNAKPSLSVLLGVTILTQAAA